MHRLNCRQPLPVVQSISFKSGRKSYIISRLWPVSPAIKVADDETTGRTTGQRREATPPTTNPPARQPASPPACQPASPPAYQPASLPACQPANPPACQPASLPACQPANPPACQPASLPTRQPASLPACQPATGRDPPAPVWTVDIGQSLRYRPAAAMYPSLRALLVSLPYGPYWSACLTGLTGQLLEVRGSHFDFTLLFRISLHLNVI